MQNAEINIFFLYVSKAGTEAVMNKINGFFSRLFYGRNGPDALGTGVMLVGIVLSLFRKPFGIIFILLAVTYALFRMFSKSVVKRRSENVRFLSFLHNTKHFFAAQFGKNKDKYEHHKIYCCPKCLMQLRVPKGKGKINITCSRCRYKFIKRT